jgi:glycosyltransferase involved in cell wall biosynthesis
VPILVSVVIPCYNHGRYLPDAIRSVREQRFPSLELIVVDDGSTDDSLRIASSEGAHVVAQANAGLGPARNAGLAVARGEFVVFLDADDELLPRAIASGVETLRARPDLACVVRRSEVMDAARQPLPATYAAVEQSDLYAEWLGQNFVWTPGAAMFRRERLAAIGGFPPDVSPAADYAVYLTLARQRAVEFQPVCAVRYRKHDSNMSRDPVLMLDATLRVLRKERAHLPPQYERAYREGLRRWRMFYGDQIVERLREAWHTRATDGWRTAAWTLARHCPGVLPTHVTRKLSRVLRGVPAAPLNKPARGN